MLYDTCVIGWSSHRHHNNNYDWRKCPPPPPPHMHTHVPIECKCILVTYTLYQSKTKILLLSCLSRADRVVPEAMKQIGRAVHACECILAYTSSKQQYYCSAVNNELQPSVCTNMNPLKLWSKSSQPERHNISTLQYGINNIGPRKSAPVLILSHFLWNSTGATKVKGERE